MSTHRSSLIGLFLLGSILVAVPLTVFITQQPQETRQHAQTVSPSDWPTYLHDSQRTANNSSETTLSPSNAGSLTKLWTFKTGGIIAASPSVVGNIVYVGSWDGNMYAIDATTGQQKWKTYIGKSNYPGCSGFQATQGVSSAATIDSGIVYVSGGDSYLYALDAGSGAVLWKVLIGDTAQGYYNWASPLLYNGNIYYGTASNCDNPNVQGKLLQISITTHQVINTFNVVPNGQTGGAIWTSPSVDPTTNTIYVSTGQGNGFALSVLALDANTLTLKSSWRIPSSQITNGDADLSTTPTIFTTPSGTELAVNGKNGLLYVFHTNSLSAGPLWEKTIAISGESPEGGQGSASSDTFGNNTLFAAGGNTTINGTSYQGAVRAFDPITGSIKWEHGATGPVVPALAFANNVIVDGAGSTLEVLNASSGTVLYHYQTGGAIYGAPSIANGKIFAGSVDTNVYAFGVPGTQPQPTTPPATPTPTASQGTSSDPIQNEPLSQQTYLDQSAYFQKYGFITSVDLMKITRDRSFPGLQTSTIQSDVATFVRQMPGANTFADDVFFDNPHVLREWADAIHATGKHVWYRGHFSNWENATAGNEIPLSQFAQQLNMFLQNPDVQAAIQNGDIFDPLSEPGDRVSGADFERALLYGTKSAYDAFTAAQKHVLIVHSVSESTLMNKTFTDDAIRKSGGVLTMDSYPEDSGINYHDPAVTSATWKHQLDVTSNNYNTIIQNNHVTIMIGEAGFPNKPTDVTDAEKVAVNSANYTLFMGYPHLSGTNYWVGPGDNNAGGRTYLFLPQTNFDSPGWTINSTGLAINAIYQTKLAGQQNTPSPIVSPTKGSLPTNTPMPIPTIKPGDTVFSITVCPHGLGNCGDNVNPNSGGNTNPLHRQRTITVSVFDINNQLLMSKQGLVNYSSTNGNSTGIIDMGTLASGSYLIKVQIDGFLQKQLPNIQQITAQHTNTLPSVSLVAGDINNDNQLDIQDYNLLISCFGSKQQTATCIAPTTTSSSGADINDDGTVDGADYNLFLRELSTQKGG